MIRNDRSSLWLGGPVSIERALATRLKPISYYYPCGAARRKVLQRMNGKEVPHGFPDYGNLSIDICRFDISTTAHVIEVEIGDQVPRLEYQRSKISFRIANCWIYKYSTLRNHSGETHSFS